MSTPQPVDATEALVTEVRGALYEALTNEYGTSIPAELVEASRRISRHLVTTVVSPRVTAARVDVLRETADHFDRFDVVTIGKTDIGSNQIPVPPAERLRLLADEIEEAHDANH